MGRLLGMLPSDDPDAVTTADRVRHFSAFRPSDPKEPAVRLNGQPKLSCGVCGGRGFLSDVETFSTYDDEGQDEEQERVGRRGRPPKPWRRTVDTRLLDLGFAG